MTSQQELPKSVCQHRNSLKAGLTCGFLAALLVNPLSPSARAQDLCLAAGIQAVPMASVLQP